MKTTLQATAELKKKGSKPDGPPMLKELQSQIRTLEYKGYCFRQRICVLNTRTKTDNDEKHSLKQQLQQGKDMISNLLQQQLRDILQFTEENNTKIRKVMNTLGKNSSRYWSVIKDTDTQPINTLKDRYAKLSTTKQGTLNAAFHFRKRQQ